MRALLLLATLLACAAASTTIHPPAFDLSVCLSATNGTVAAPLLQPATAPSVHAYAPASAAAPPPSVPVVPSLIAWLLSYVRAVAITSGFVFLGSELFRDGDYVHAAI